MYLFTHYTKTESSYKLSVLTTPATLGGYIYIFSEVELLRSSHRRITTQFLVLWVLYLCS